MPFSVYSTYQALWKKAPQTGVEAVPGHHERSLKRLTTCIRCHPDPSFSVLCTSPLVLLLSGASVYANNIRATWSILSTLGHDGHPVDDYLTREALLTLASSNLIIAVSGRAEPGRVGLPGKKGRGRKGAHLLL